MRTEQPTKCLYRISYGGCKTNLSPPPVIHWWPFRAGGSDVVSVACFGVRFSVMFHLIIVHYTFSSVGLLSVHFFGNSCPLGWTYVLIVFCLFVIVIYFPFGLRAGFGFRLLQFLFIAFLLLLHHNLVSVTQPLRDIS